MDKERIDGFRSAFAPGETLFWQVPAAARERMAFYSENLPRLFSEKITAVFAVSDHYALEFMRFLQGQGIRVPEDVQIIGFDDTLASRESVPALTTIHQDAALRARTAIRRLEALRDGTPCDAGIVLPVELVARESTRRLPSSVWGRGTSASWRSLICPWRSALSCPHGCAARNTPLSPFGQVLAR